MEKAPAASQRQVLAWLTYGKCKKGEFLPPPNTPSSLIFLFVSKFPPNICVKDERPKKQSDTNLMPSTNEWNYCNCYFCYL